MNNINELEIFINDVCAQEFINLEYINKFKNIIAIQNFIDKCLISKYKLDKFINLLDIFIKIEKNNKKIFNIFTFDIIYFLLFIDYHFYVNTFIKANNIYIKQFLLNHEYNYKILELLIKKEYINTIAIFIDNELSNLLSIVNIHSKYSKNYKEFEKIINKVLTKEHSIILSIVNIEYINCYNKEFFDILKNYVFDFTWLKIICPDYNIVEIVIYILNYLNKYKTINDNFKLSLLKKNKLLKKFENYYIFNNIINLFYFYDIKITNENYINLIENGYIINNYQRFGIKMDNDTISFLLSKNKIPTIIEDIPNEKTMCTLFEMNNLDKKNIINFINYGGKITSQCVQKFFSKYMYNIEENKESKIIENVIIQYYNISLEDFIIYEKKMSKKTGLLYILPKKENNINIKTNINLPDIKIIINEKKLNNFKIKATTKILFEYFLDYIQINNLKIYDYFVTDALLSKLFGVHKSCLLDIDKIKNIFNNL